MKSDLEAIEKALEQARAKLESLRQKCTGNDDKHEAIDDAELGLGWVAKRLEKLKEHE